MKTNSSNSNFWKGLTIGLIIAIFILMAYMEFIENKNVEKSYVRGLTDERNVVAMSQSSTGKIFLMDSNNNIITPTIGQVCQQLLNNAQGGNR